MVCKKCGEQIDYNARFCAKCGEPVGDNKSSISRNFDVPITTVTNNGSQNKINDAEKKGLMAALIALMIVIVGAIGVGVFIRYSENSKSSYVRSSSDNDSDDNDDDDERAVDDESETETSQAETEVLEASTETNETEEIATKIDLTDIDINVRQVDTSNFPEITLYANITDPVSGNVVEGIENGDLVVSETVKDTTKQVDIKDLYRVANSDTNISVNLIMDASGSMTDYNKMTQAKNAAKSLVASMNLKGGDRVEVISFDDYVYLEQEFTSNQDTLDKAIDGVSEYGATALYDALYSGLYQTYEESNVKCVIGFTDGMENDSSYSYEDVVYMSKNTGIPVYIIGIGGDYDTSKLQSLAEDCSGKYYTATVKNLESVLENIYMDIYQEQKDYYVIKYVTDNTRDRSNFREVEVKTSETAAYDGYYAKEYIPDADMAGVFSVSYSRNEYMIADSDKRLVTESDLAGMSLAELRIARNEILARHGRQFNDSTLNQWFYSKTWYLNIDTKYAPETFDSISPSPLSDIEIENTEFIQEYEQNIMDTQDIYPDAASVKLAEYDLALSKAVLKTALSQMQTYKSTTVLEINKKLVENAINSADVQY
jgi:VWFA-related protein